MAEVSPYSHPWGSQTAPPLPSSSAAAPARSAEIAFEEFVRCFEPGTFLQLATLERLRQLSAAEIGDFLGKTVPNNLSFNVLASVPPPGHFWPRALKRCYDHFLAQFSVPISHFSAFKATEWTSMNVPTKVNKIRELAKIALHHNFYYQVVANEEFTRDSLLDPTTIMETIQKEYAKAKDESALTTIFEAVRTKLQTQLQTHRAALFEKIWLPRHITMRTHITPLLHSEDIPEKVREAFETFKTNLVIEVKERASKCEQCDWMQLVNDSEAYKAFKKVLYPVASILYPVASTRAQASARAVRQANSTTALELIDSVYNFSSLLGKTTDNPEELHLLLNLGQLSETTEAIMCLFNTEIKRFSSSLISEDWIQCQTVEMLQSFEGRSAKLQIPYLEHAVREKVMAEMKKIGQVIWQKIYGADGRRQLSEYEWLGSGGRSLEE